VGFVDGEGQQKTKPNMDQRAQQQQTGEVDEGLSLGNVTGIVGVHGR
jgi:hypothetical protein